MGFWRFVEPGSDFGEPLASSYSPTLVLLSFLAASLAGYAALEVVERMAAGTSRKVRRIWLAAGAVAMGSGIWAMHFIGMLAFSIPVPVNYDLAVTLVSMLPAIFASAMALHYMSRATIEFWRLNVGGLFMAGGIGGMHYTGMEAMLMDAYMLYDPALFVLSIVVAHVLATAALYIKFANQRLALADPVRFLGAKVISAGVLGAAVCGMHYTAMAAASYYPEPRMQTPTMTFEPLWMSVTIAAVSAFIIALAVISAIVDRRMAAMSQTLLESEERSRLILQSAAEGILGIDQEGTIVFANPSALRMLQYELDEVKGRNIHDWIHPRRSDGTACSQERCELYVPVRDGQARESRSERFVRRDSSNFPVRFTSTPIVANERQVGAVITFSDISEALQVEEALRQAMQAAEEATRAKSAFLANMSHEIRTPMNGILGMAGLLRDTPLNHDQQDNCDAILRSAESLLTIINDILDFSKIEAGRLELETMEFDLRTLVEDVVELLASRAEEQNNELVYSVEPGAPRTLAGDPGRIRQVLLNLASNAVKFTQHGDVFIRVSVASQDEMNTEVLFEVSDTGVGIPANRLEGIFDSFTQADVSTTRKYGGTGLGLTITKQLVELMGGELGVESKEGSGSCFWFRLKLETRPDQDYSEIPNLSSLKDKRVLIVDDNDLNRFIMLKQVAGIGMRTFDARSGAEAITILLDAAERNEPIDIALVDFQMPGMDGFQFAKIVKEESRLAETRLILLTSVGQRGETRKVKEAGFAGYLVKPVKQSHLLDCILLAVASDGGFTPGESQRLVTRHTIAESRANRKYRILVAEDNVVNQKVARGILQKQGYRVDVVANGLEALRAVQSFPYDLILMDCQMPEMDGYEATREIRGLGEQGSIPIVAMTANAMEGDRDDCISAGMDGYVSKPVQPETMLETIGNFLDADGACEEGAEVATGAPEALDEEDLFSAQALLARLGNNEDLFVELLQTFKAQFPEQITELRVALTNTDGATLSSLAHTLKGSAGNLAVEGVRRIAAEIEMAAKENRFAEVESMLSSIEAVAAQLDAQLDAEIASMIGK